MRRTALAMLLGALTITAIAQTTGPETLQQLRAKQREFLTGAEQVNRLPDPSMDRAFPSALKFCRKDGVAGLWVPAELNGLTVMVARNNLEMNAQFGFEDTIPKEIRVGTLKHGTFFPLPNQHVAQAPGTLYTMSLKLTVEGKTLACSRTLPTLPSTLPEWSSLN